MKKPDLIKAAEVPLKFDDDRIRQFAELLKIDASLHQPLKEAIHILVRVFIREATAPQTDGDVAREVVALHTAAERDDYEQAAELVAGMSKPTRAHLNKRRKRTGLTIPKPSLFRTHARRQAACEGLRQITSQGGHRDESGKWVPHLYLPKRQLELEMRAQQRTRLALRKHGIMIELKELEAVRRKAVADVRAEMVEDAKAQGSLIELRPPKRDAAENFVSRLQATLKSITGKDPPISARLPQTAETPVPFVRVVQQCLGLMGADADAIGAINRVRARHPERRPVHEKARKP